jgi:hypothetical protein
MRAAPAGVSLTIGPFFFIAGPAGLFAEQANQAA